MLSKPDRTRSRGVAPQVRERILRGGERIWRLEDFRDLSFQAVAQALSRMARQGAIERLSKGVYYQGRRTVLGASRPSTAALRERASRSRAFFPSGGAAANLLGFSTQIPARGELSTSASSLPRKLVGQDVVVHGRRPASWAALPEADAAMLEFLRQGGRTSELSPTGTVKRTLRLLAEANCFRRLVEVADSEPPRVRALLGALGEELGASRKALQGLRASLNPSSKFDFGSFAGLPRAREWQGKGGS